MLMLTGVIHHNCWTKRLNIIVVTSIQERKPKSTKEKVEDKSALFQESMLENGWNANWLDVKIVLVFNFKIVSLFLKRACISGLDNMAC